MSQTISIITPWLDHPEFIADYEHAVRGEGVEVIVIDNGSSQANAALLCEMVRRLGGKYIRNEQNRWFAGANNQGLATAGGQVVVFLNNDIAGDPAWLDAVKRDVHCGGMYGPTLRQIRIDSRTYSYLEGWCLAGVREEFQQIEGWDAKSYEMPYFEDTDLSVRAVNAGLKLIPVSWNLTHKKNGTSGSIPGLSFAFKRNQKVFASRMGRTMRPAELPCSGPYEFVRAGRVAEAERIYRDAVRQEKNRPELWTQYAQVLEVSGRFEAAEEALMQALDLDPRYAEAYDTLGMLFLRTNRFAEAAKEFRILMKSRPDSAEAAARLALALCAVRDYAAAIETARLALRIDARNLSASLCLSDALRETGAFNEAASVAQAACECHPTIPDVYRVLGMALRRLRSPEKAQIAFEQSLALDPHNALTRSEYQALLDDLNRARTVTPEK